jgi:glycosyltransferase involved in cell wall biosynthesis
LRQVQLSVVVPAFNEVNRLPDTLPRFLQMASDGGHEFILVDDGSTDATAELARDCIAAAGCGTLISLSRNRGKGAAVRAGMARARGDVVAFADADMSCDIDDIPMLVEALADADVAVGSRAAAGAQVSDESVTRVNLGRVFNGLVRTLTGIRLLDTQCGFKAFRSRAAGALFHMSTIDGWAFDVELLILARRLGYRVTEVPVRWHGVDGSHVRPVRDSASMACDVLRATLRWTNRTAIAGVRMYESEHTALSDATTDVRRNLRHGDLVLPIPSGALSLLPHLEPQLTACVASRLSSELPGVRFQPVSLAPEVLLRHTAPLLRRAEP